MPNKASRNKAVLSSVSVFGNDDDDEDSIPAVNKTLKKDATKTVLKRQVQLELEKAIADDPTVYEYDSIYDNLQATKASNDNRIESKGDRKPKYIGNLIKAAEDRKKEMERRMEKKIHKEREAEKGKFDDKEAFVTDAYRQKMELMKQEEENERRKDQLEAMNDVTKQSDLSGFYRNLLKQTVGEEGKPVPVKSEVIDCNLPLDQNLTAEDRDDSSESDSDSSSDEEDEASNRAREREDQHKSRDRQQQDSRRTADRHSTDNKDKVDDRKNDRPQQDSRRTDDRHSTNGKKKENDRKHDRHSRDNFNDRKEPAANKSSKSSNNRLEEQDCQTVDKECRVKEKSECDTAKRRNHDTRLDEKRVKTDVNETLNAKPVNIVKRTTESSLEDARARYLARKAAMQVPVLKEDSD